MCWPQSHRPRTLSTRFAPFSVTACGRRFGRNSWNALRYPTLPNSMEQLRATPISVSNNVLLNIKKITVVIFTIRFVVNIDNKIGAIGFVSRIIPSVYPISIIRADSNTGEPIRGPNGLCQVCLKFIFAYLISISSKSFVFCIRKWIQIVKINFT